MGEEPVVRVQEAAPQSSEGFVVCETCGTTCVQHDGLRVIRHVRGEEPQTLAELCLHCFARGVLWAARAAHEEQEKLARTLFEAPFPTAESSPPDVPQQPPSRNYCGFCDAVTDTTPAWECAACGTAVGGRD